LLVWAWALTNEAIVTSGGPHPPVELEPSPPGASVVVLAGRATRVPQAAGTSGIQRTVTVTPKGPLSWEPAPDLGESTGPKLHGMQEVIALMGLS
jgi:hypothetical protein